MADGMVFGISQRRPVLDLRPVGLVELGLEFLRLFRLSPVSMIPPTSHARSPVIILATDSVFKQHT